MRWRAPIAIGILAAQLGAVAMDVSSACRPLMVGSLEGLDGTLETVLKADGRPTMLLLGGRRSKDAKTAWYRRLAGDRAVAGRVDVVVMVQLADLPFFVPASLVRERVRGELRRLASEIPGLEHASAYLDWGTAWSAAYGADLAEVTVVVLGKDHCFKGSVAGDCSEKNYRQVVDWVGDVRRVGDLSSQHGR